MKNINRRQVLFCLSLVCLSLTQAKPAISAPTLEEYEQFRGGVYVPECDPDFDIPKFLEIQKKGGLTGAIGWASFDGEEAKSLLLAVGGSGSCTYYRTNSGKIHKVARFGRYFGYNGKPIKRLLSLPNIRDSIFIDSEGGKHTIEHLSAPLSQTRSIEKIPDGKYLYAYFNGEPDFLEIKAEKYRGLVLIPGKVGIESVTLSPWQAISESTLKFVGNGVIYNPNTPKTPYWCSQKASGWQPLSRKAPVLYCTSEGWTSTMPENFRGMSF